MTKRIQHLSSTLVLFLLETLTINRLHSLQLRSGFQPRILSLCGYYRHLLFITVHVPHLVRQEPNISLFMKQHNSDAGEKHVHRRNVNASCCIRCVLACAKADNGHDQSLQHREISTIYFFDWPMANDRPTDRFGVVLKILRVYTAEIIKGCRANRFFPQRRCMYSNWVYLF
jgi:hypothetical protein